MTVQLALYKGKGMIGNALIRWWTGSQYSHCELVADGVCYSSSIMDGGVRSKVIDLDNGNWDLISTDWVTPEDVREYFETTDADSYGYIGLIVSQVFNRNKQVSNEQFCSEWCAHLLGLPNPVTYSPGTLGDMVLYVKGLMDEQQPAT